VIQYRIVNCDMADKLKKSIPSYVWIVKTIFPDIRVKKPAILSLNFLRFEFLQKKDENCWFLSVKIEKFVAVM